MHKINLFLHYSLSIIVKQKLFDDVIIFIAILAGKNILRI